MRLSALAVVFALLLPAGCRKHEGAVVRPLQVGMFPNITHAQALVGNAEGSFARALAPTGGVELRLFQAGPTAMEALLAGSLDATYVGTGPAVNAYVKGNHEVRIIAAAVDGGARLVTRTASSAQALRGKKLGVPQLGNTQDIALRHWLQEQGLDPAKDVTILPLANPELVAAFARGALEGGWVPEPWGARMVALGGKTLVDERTLWPGGRFQTTVLVTTTRALAKQRPALAALVKTHASLTRAWQADPAAFRSRVAAAFAKLTGGDLPGPVMEDAFAHLSPALEPDLAQLAAVAKEAKALGYLPSDDVSGIVDRSLYEPPSNGAPAN